MKKFIPALAAVFLFLSTSLNAQTYTEKQTRHRFAQLTLGMDYQIGFGGSTVYADPDNNPQLLFPEPTSAPRILIGGTHFWGHADIYIAIPFLGRGYTAQNQEINLSTGVETVFKCYPWRIEHNKIRPFIGLSLTPFYYEQSNGNLEFGNGPELNHTSVPVYAGFTFNNKNHLVELGAMWNYNNKQEYHVIRTEEVTIETPPIYLNFSYRFMLETTQSAEKSWESGRAEEVTQQLAAKGKLNSFHIGVGMSSAFWLKESEYNTSNRPYIEPYSTSIMPDFTLGYYLHKPDLGFALAYRSYGASTNSYGAIQQLRRKSLVFEATKFLFDYHGFVPFVGPAISQENLSFRESFERQLTYDETVKKTGYGLTFGWDIRPNRIQTFILRTNLRWFPNLKLELDNNQTIAFDNIEFNFIQLILYPSRMF